MSPFALQREFFTVPASRELQGYSGPGTIADAHRQEGACGSKESLFSLHSVQWTSDPSGPYVCIDPKDRIFLERSERR